MRENINIYTSESNEMYSYIERLEIALFCVSCVSFLLLMCIHAINIEMCQARAEAIRLVQMVCFTVWWTCKWTEIHSLGRNFILTREYLSLRMIFRINLLIFG